MTFAGEMVRSLCKLEDLSLLFCSLPIERRRVIPKALHQTSGHHKNRVDSNADLQKRKWEQTTINIFRWKINAGKEEERSLTCLNLPGNQRPRAFERY